MGWSESNESNDSIRSSWWSGARMTHEVGDWSGVGTGMGLEKGLELTTGIDNGGVVELRPAGNVGVLKSYGI